MPCHTARRRLASCDVILLCYSIMGNNDTDEQVGIVPRFCNELFQQVELEAVRDVTVRLFSRASKMM